MTENLPYNRINYFPSLRWSLPSIMVVRLQKVDFLIVLYNDLFDYFTIMFQTQV